jgi:hypothetical protein
MMNFSGREMNQLLNRGFIEAMRMMNEYASKKELALVKKVSNDETKANVSIATRKELLN